MSKPPRALHLLLALSACCHARADEADVGRDAAHETKHLSPPSMTQLARGRLRPHRIEGVPDWAIDGVEDCYTDALRTEPAQHGSLRFTVTPPAKDGPVSVALEGDGTLREDVIACARGRLGGIYHYATQGRAQPAVTASLALEPELETAPPLPTAHALREVLDDRYGKGGVVKVVGLDVLEVHHRSSMTTFLRDFSYRVELEFVVDGFEGDCVHMSSYKRFESAPVVPMGAGHQCKSAPRKAGDRASDTSETSFQLTPDGWRVGYDPIYYCGDSRCGPGR
jgi:hypothetical protein